MRRQGSSNSRNVKNTFLSYAIATVGLFLVAFGVALSIVANLGTAPLSCPACIMTGTWGLTVGNWNILVNMVYLLVQVAILRKNFKIKYLMQIPASLIFGYLIDLSLACIQWLHPVTFLSKFGLLLLACLVTAFGVSVEVMARAWMLSAEMTVYAIVKTSGRQFSSVKVAMDSSVVAVSVVLALLMYGNPFGSGEFTGLVDWLSGAMEGVVTGFGTLVLAFLAGWLMKLTDPVVDKLMDHVIDKAVLQKYGR